MSLATESVPGSEGASVRDQINRFFADHAVAWELAMAALAIFYVAIGFAQDSSAAPIPMLQIAELAVTWIFIGEFSVRVTATRNRGRYLRDHVLDLVALIPIARGVRVFRLLRLLRLIRAFAGFRRALLGVERVANHHGLGSLVIAWFGTMLLCSWAFLLAESESNPLVNDAGDAMWWGLMTLTGGPTTVQAVTAEGQVITAILLIVGVGLFTAITAVLVSFLVSTDRTPTLVTDLQNLEAARAAGVIDQVEFDHAKASILSRFAA